MRNHPDRHLDELFARPMFIASVAFLALLAAALHLHEVSGVYPYVFAACVGGMTVLYPFYVVELAWHFFAGSVRWKQYLLYCLVPPLRLGARDGDQGKTVWLPWMGRQEVTPQLTTLLDRQFSLPMIVIALMVLPLMAVEFFMADWIAQNTLLGFSVHAATALIWMAFAAEFIVMISIANKKLRYCRDHWIDLAIILLPLIAFLRSLRLARLMRLQQITRTVRIWRMRGLAMRLFRGLLAVESIDRLVRGKPEIGLVRLQETLAVKELEIQELRDEILEIRRTIPVDRPRYRKSA